MSILYRAESAPTPIDDGALTTKFEASSPVDPNPNNLTQADIERLGRERPAVFKALYVEIGFASTVVLSLMMSEFFISGFNIVLPSMAGSLHIKDADRTWPAEVPNLTCASLLLPFSRLCSVYGARRVFLGGHAWLIVWSLVCGFSQNTIMLIVSRALQGIGFAAFLPAGLALLGQAYRPGPRKNLVYSFYGAFACIGFYIGIIIGGLAAEFLNWRWYFWIGTILTFAMLVMGCLTIPRSFDAVDPEARMDWWGVGTIVPGLVLVVFALTDGGHAPHGWKTPYVYITLILGVLFLAAAVYTQGWISAQPLLPADLFRPKYMKRLIAALFCCYGTFGLHLFYSSFYIQNVLHASPLQTAAWFTPMAVGGVVLALVGGFVLHILPGTILMIVAGLGFMLSTLLFALLPAQENGSPSTNFLFWAYVFSSMIGATIGVDITFNVTNVFITTAMPKRLQAAAGGLINSLIFLGISFWLGIGELVVSSTTTSHGHEEKDLRRQYQTGFWVGVALAATVLCFTFTIRLARASAELTADEKAELAKESEST